MVQQHEINSIIARFKVDDLVEFMSESIDAIRRCRHLLDEISNYQNGDLDEDELLDELDSFQLSTTLIARCSSGFFSVNAGINHYLRKTVSSISSLVYLINMITESGCYPTDAEIDKMITKATDVVAGLSYILVYEFKMDETIATEDDPVEDEVVFSYRRRLNKGAIEVVKPIVETALKFKIKLEFFDAYPDLEEPFEAFMGPYISSIDQEKLSLELVNQLVSGEITADELFELVKQDELEEISWG